MSKSFTPTKQKICEICGELFWPRSRAQKACDSEHSRPCPICGSPVRIKYKSDLLKCCSKKCILELRKRTSIERFGVDNAAKSEEIKAKQAATCQERYGVSTPFLMQDFQQKARATSLERYGTQYPIQSEEVQSKFRQNMQSKYSVDYAFQLPHVREKILEAVSNPSSRVKAKQTNMQRYGVPWTCMRDKCRSSYHTVSNVNLQFAELLQQNNISYKMEFPIESRSYDFYLSDMNMLIEIDPTITHNTEMSIWENSEPRSATYQLEKSNLAWKHGYRCIHIFDWDSWDKVVSILKPKEVLYGRNTTIQEIAINQANEFEAQHHLQGGVRGQSICLGLYYQDNLVQVMTFGKPRYNKNYQYELLRLCTDSSYAVIGGAQKLWKYFLQKYSPESVISYCDRAKFSGKVYSDLSFQLKEITSPNKLWSREDKVVTNNLLLQRGYDQLFHTNYGKGTSNEQLMIEHGWLPVYDCGQAVYVYQKKK